MTTRRSFLAANLAGAAGWALGSQPMALASGQNSEAPIARFHRDFWNDWPNFLTAQMEEARCKRKAELAAIQSPAQAQQRILYVRSKLWELIGGPLKKTPLNPRTTGTIHRSTYRIEKVIFESLPQVYVTANLYIPASGTPPFPAVLSPLGHTEDGKEYRNYQYFFQDLARRGYVVLAPDPYGQGERWQYINPKTGRSLYGPTGEHDQAGRPMLLFGDTFALYRVWDCIRGLDYLLSRPEVDAHRVGCCGQSGGGTMTMYLTALEPRFQVASSVEGNCENMAGPFFAPPGDSADAEQNIIGGLPIGIDRGDLLWAFAPKPLLVCYTTHDEGVTYSPVYEEGTEEIYDGLKQVYGVLGAQEKVSLFASHLPHDFDFFQRRAVCDWFDRWLGVSPAESTEAPFDASPPGTLNCTSTGQVLTSLGGRSVVQVNINLARQILPESPFRNGAQDAAAKDNVRSQIPKLLALPEHRTTLNARILSSNPRKDVVIEEIQFESQPGVRVMGWFVRPSGSNAPYSTVLYISDRGGIEVVMEPGSMDGVLGAGHAVCALALRGINVSSPRLPNAGPLFYGDGRNIGEWYAWTCLILGQSAVGQRVWDTLRAIDYLASRPDVGASQIRILGAGGAGIAAMLAAAIDSRPRSILLDRTLVSFMSLVEAENYSLKLDWFVPSILRRFDLPDVVAALNPRPCWLLNSVDPGGRILAESAVREDYSQRVDLNSPLFQSVRFVTEPDRDSEETYLKWLASTA
ncbi:MAG: alpha/beta hydrolase family protein [Terriglobia bacterium]